MRVPRRIAPRLLIVAVALAAAASTSAAWAQAWLGYNVKRTPNAPWDSTAAIRSMHALRATGANTIAIVVFLWQPDPHSSALVRGSDISDAELAQALSVARNLGLRVLLKPHVWVPGHWAGEVRPRDHELADWFARYRRELDRLARIAQAGGAAALAVGVELKQLANRPEWSGLIRSARAQFKGRLTYVASSMDEAEAFAHWEQVDAVTVSLYPRADDLDRWVDAMRRETGRLTALAGRVGRAAWVGEIGVRSMHGALDAPWASPEQRSGAVDLALQAQALSAARKVIAQARVIDAFLVWCWYTDPQAGGERDTDFTPQGKPALDTLMRD